MKLRPILLVSLIALALAPAAQAKFCVRLALDPARPVVGRIAVVLMTTLGAPDGQPLAIAGDPPRMLLLVDGPRTLLEVPLRRALGTPAVWWARVRFPRAGTWTLSWALWGGSSSPCAPTLRVRVR